MERDEALSKLQAAFPDADAEVSLVRDMIWFKVKKGDQQHGLAFKTYEHVDAAIRTMQGWAEE